jgi:hypothetical protein
LQDIQVKREQKLLNVTPVGQFPCAGHVLFRCPSMRVARGAGVSWLTGCS